MSIVSDVVAGPSANADKHYFISSLGQSLQDNLRCHVASGCNGDVLESSEDPAQPILRGVWTTDQLTSRWTSPP